MLRRTSSVESDDRSSTESLQARLEGAAFLLASLSPDPRSGVAMLIPLALAFQVRNAELTVTPILHGRLNAEAHALWASDTGDPMLVIPYALTADGYWRPGDSVLVSLNLTFKDPDGTRKLSQPALLRSGGRRQIGYLQLPATHSAGAGNSRPTSRDGIVTSC